MMSKVDQSLFGLTRRKFVGTCTAAVFLNTIDLTVAAATDEPWSPMAFGKVSAGGDLAKRTAQNERRVHHPAYCVPKVFSSVTQLEFPGDWVGRALLADTLLARSTLQDPQQGSQIVKALPAQFNAEGFLGRVLNLTQLDEQQIGPHGWLISGLSEYWQWQRHPLARELLGTMVRNLALPLRDLWETYPIASNARQVKPEGKVISHLQVGRWKLTTDVGTLFVLLDGLTREWQIERSSELKAVIDAGIDRFLQMDLLAVHAQAHATLSTLRALLRMYALTGELRLLKAVEERYDLYRREAMTEHYANTNWMSDPHWGLPNEFTEPCAVIDSFIVAVDLWRFTGKPEYLEEAHLIWFNGVESGQRATGGFGCDSASGRQTPYVEMKLVYELYWCCTLRGAEGHSYAIQATYHTRPGELAATFFSDSTVDLALDHGNVVLQQITQYPYDGQIQLKVLSSTVRAPITLRLFTPSWMSQPRLRLNHQSLPHRTDAGFLVARWHPRTGDSLTLTCTLQRWVRPTRNVHSLPDHHAFHAGPLLLGHTGKKAPMLRSTSELIAEAPGVYRVQGQDVVLKPINDANVQPLPQHDPLDASVQAQRPPEESWFFWHNKPSEDTLRRQVLFKDS